MVGYIDGALVLHGLGEKLVKAIEHLKMDADAMLLDVAKSRLMTKDLIKRRTLSDIPEIPPMPEPGTVLDSTVDAVLVDAEKVNDIGESFPADLSAADRTDVPAKQGQETNKLKPDIESMKTLSINEVYGWYTKLLNSSENTIWKRFSFCSRL